MKKIKVKNFNEIKIGDLVEYNSRLILILDYEEEESFYKTLELDTMKILKNRSLFIFKHKLFILEP